jgi:hypothetical protein
MRRLTFGHWVSRASRWPSRQSLPSFGGFDFESLMNLVGFYLNIQQPFKTFKNHERFEVEDVAILPYS